MSVNGYFSFHIMSQARGDRHPADDGPQLRQKHTLVLFLPVMLGHLQATPPPNKLLQPPTPSLAYKQAKPFSQFVFYSLLKFISVNLKSSMVKDMKKKLGLLNVRGRMLTGPVLEPANGFYLLSFRPDKPWSVDTTLLAFFTAIPSYYQTETCNNNRKWI